MFSTVRSTTPYEASVSDRSLASHWDIVASTTRILLTGLDHWHLLSLDAPTVAMVWTWFLAKSNHVLLPSAAIMTIGLAVWMLYAADRLLDSRVQTSSHDKAGRRDLEPRHHFHRRHRRAFRLGILLVSVTLGLLVPHLAAQAIRLYLVLGTFLFGYFLLIHAVSPSLAMTRPHPLLKEVAVGIFFSAATFVPTVARDPRLRLALVPGALLFAILCGLNCLFIYAWEHPRSLSHAHAPTRFAVRFLPQFAIALMLTGVTLIIVSRSLPWQIPAACIVAASLLLVLHRNRHYLSPTSLRATADLCLLTPLLMLPLL